MIIMTCILGTSGGKMWVVMKIYLSLSTDIFWIITRLSISRWGCEAPFYLRWDTHPTGCVWKWDSDTRHLHSWLFYLFSCSNIYNVKHNFFHNFVSTSSAVSVAGGSQPGIHSCRDGEKNFVRASEEEESRGTRKRHKIENSRTLWRMC